MPRITPIPTTRISDLFSRQRVLSQLGADQIDLQRLQTQISTGRRVQLPSDDAPAALRGIALQRLIEQKTQARTNLQINQSYLSATDSALSNISNLLTDSRAAAQGVLGTLSTAEQRESAATQIDRALEQLIDAGNQKFRGRYLFAGSKTTQLPFEGRDGFVRFNGNEQQLQSYSDVDVLFNSSISGSRVFGALSLPVVGSADLNPIVSADTLLSDLNGGQGIALGTIRIGDGTVSSDIDLSSASTLGDIAALIQAHPPPGRALQVEITHRALKISLDAPGGGNLQITEADGANTASQLGIYSVAGIGVGPITGQDLDPSLRLTTPLADLLGTRAVAIVSSSGDNNNLRIEANAIGAAANGYAVNFTNDPAVAAGSETVSFNAGTSTFTVHIAAGQSTANQAAAALNAHPAFNALFTASLDRVGDQANDGDAPVALSAAGTLAGGAGTLLDLASGLQVSNGGQTYTIDLSGAVTVEDLLNKLNQSPADLLATINPDGRTLSFRSRLSGADFAIGENGGTTASQLGVRSLTTAVKLDSLNHGLGVHSNAEGNDFLIRRKDGVELGFRAADYETIGDLIAAINNNPNNLDPNTRVTAQLATRGNGIELIDNGLVGSGLLSIHKVNGSQAAEDLGLIPVGQPSLSAAAPSIPATAQVALPGPNNDLVLTANQSGPQRNGVQISFTNGGPVGASPLVTFNPLAGQLTIAVEPGVTTANDILAQINAQGDFTAALNAVSEPGNTGLGIIAAPSLPTTPVLTAGGTPQSITGREPHPQETESAFNALIRLRDALRVNNSVQADRALALLDDSNLTLNFARAEVGATQQALDVLDTRIEDESINLEQALSEDIDVDLATAISQLTARQAALEASLRMTAQLTRLTLLEFL